MKLEIRVARAADLASVLGLSAQLHPAGTVNWFDEKVRSPGSDLPKKPIGIWKEMLSDPKLLCLVAFADGKAVATCVLVIVPNLTRGGRPFAVVENVVTDQAFRRKGIGQAILRHALKIAQAKGCYKVMLMTGSKRKAVHQFYEKAGFEKGLKTAFVARVARNG